MKMQMLKVSCRLAMSAILMMGLGWTFVWARDPAKLAQALTSPIVEGQSLASVHLGSTEGEVVTALGVPDEIDSFHRGSIAPVKMAHYLTAPPGTILRVVFREGRVEAVLMAVNPYRALALTGKVRGVGLGSPVQAVRAAFGPGTAGRLWYPAIGIGFNPADRDPADRYVVYAILVARPGLNEELVEMYGRVGH